MVDIKDGTACVHRACLSHKTYPCPFCGRIAGRALTTSEKIVNAMMKHFASADGGSWTDKEWFEEALEVITPILDFRSVRHIVYAESDTSLINTEEEAKRTAGFAISDDLFAGTEFSFVDAMKNPERHTNDGGFLIPGDVLHAPIYTPLWPNWVGRLLLRWFRIRDKSKDTTMQKEFYKADVAAAFHVPTTLLGLPVFTREQQRKDHFWKTKIMPRLREYLKEHQDD